MEQQTLVRMYTMDNTANRAVGEVYPATPTVVEKTDATFAFRYVLTQQAIYTAGAAARAV